MDMKKILVVDDEQPFTRAVKANLSAKYNIKVENHGARVCDVVRDFSPDLILMDIMMPDMDGCTVVQKLKECPSSRDIPVVFITALVGKSKSSRHQTMVNDLPGIAKPVSLEDLIACIEANLKKTETSHAH
jgi:CheY-like chemotaxis protein